MMCCFSTSVNVLRSLAALELVACSAWKVGSRGGNRLGWRSGWRASESADGRGARLGRGPGPQLGSDATCDPAYCSARPVPISSYMETSSEEASSTPSRPSPRPSPPGTAPCRPSPSSGAGRQAAAGHPPGHSGPCSRPAGSQLAGSCAFCPPIPAACPPSTAAEETARRSSRLRPHPAAPMSGAGGGGGACARCGW
eukprot:scaffold21707_cov67-Isochrysis_galbana.AAC.2